MSFTKFIFYLILIAGVAAGVINHLNAKKRTPYIYSITDMAARYEDKAIAAEVNWEKLRAFMKADLIERASKTNPLTGDKSRGDHLRPEHINQVVDYYIQPQNIVLLFRLKKGYAPYYYESDFISSIKPYKLTGIEVTFDHPEKKSVSHPIYGKANVKANFTLNNRLEWELTQLHVPLYFVPDYIPTAEEEDMTIEKLNEKGLLPGIKTDSQKTQ